MIPIRLELTNFLSYRDTAEIDFQSIELACITGPNGAGKSSILDAITWALFGQSRSRSDDDLVNRVAAAGGDQAEVRFTFGLEDSVYRVVRQKKPRRSSVLELQLQTSDGGWKTLSESKVRETQAAIEALLRMNYDTFTNASFLLQGKADEFTTKTPNRRKEILADLLGVTEWDRYREAAAARRKTTEGRMTLLDARLADISAELEEETARQEALASAESERSNIVERLQIQEKLLTQMRATASALAQQKELIASQEAAVARLEATLATTRQTRATRQEEHDRYLAILDEAKQIEADYKAWQSAESELQAWQEKADRYNDLLRQKEPLQLAVTQARTRLEQRQQTLEQQAARLETIAEEQATVSAEVEATLKRQTALQADLTELSEKEAELLEARADLQRLVGEQELLTKERNQLDARAQLVQSLAKEKSTIRKSLTEAQSTVEQYSEQLAAVESQSQRHATLLAERDSILGQQPLLKEEMESLQERIEKLRETDSSACPLCGQPLTADHLKHVIEESKVEGKKMGDRYRGHRDRLKKIDVELKQLTASLQTREKISKERDARQEQLVRAEARLDEIKKTMAEWEAEGAQRLVELVTLLADNSAETEQRARVKSLAEATQETSALRKDLQNVQQRLASAEARLAELERMQSEWETSGSQTLIAIREQLEKASYAAEEQAQIDQLNKQLAEIGYDFKAHQAARAAKESHAQAPARYQTLKEAEAAVKPLAQSLAELDSRIQEMETDLTQQQQGVAQLREQVTSLSAEAGDLRSVEDEVFALREAEITAARRVGAAQQQLAVLEQQREQAEKIQAEKNELMQLTQRLRTLEKSFGREGVQSLLIEQAVPEIEEHANALLDRLTDGQMRVTFETVKQLKSRDATAETLDITIADREGERPYENYSGGEQFRVNFAIRLALSQLLAHRSGARLQTLVIDEGFGSQDPAGRQRLIEAINVIQHDFACILVITHIDELRDAFPQRIEVSKGLDGSQIEVA